MYNKDEGDLRGKIGFVYALLCAVGCILTWRFVPEMKSRSAVEIDVMFEKKISARKFSSTIVSNDAEVDHQLELAHAAEMTATGADTEAQLVSTAALSKGAGIPHS